MLTQIKLKNFKIFKEETTFPLAKINLLTGINGRGKSSLLQSLLLMRQSIEQDENTNQIYLNGSCVRLGSFEDVKNEDFVYGDKILFEYLFIYNKIKFVRIYELSNESIESNESRFLDINKIHLLKYDNDSVIATYSVEKIDEHYKDSTSEFVQIVFINNLSPTFTVDNNTVGFEFYEFLATYNNIFKKTHYISADRIGPKDFYLKENLGKFINVGAKGEFTANVLSSKKYELVNDKLYLGEDAKTLVQQTEEWLKEIFGEARFSIDDTSREVIYLLFNTKSTSNRYKPSNVGFGYSYVLPIIVSGLIAQAGEILIVENPEAHLHPRAQSKLTHFLAKVAACGVQVFIESHSEHILNALQIAVKKEEYEITNEDVSVLYFHERENGYFTQIPIKPNGKIEVWPDGFFDQTEKDLDTILGM